MFLQTFRHVEAPGFGGTLLHSRARCANHASTTRSHSPEYQKQHTSMQERETERLDTEKADDEVRLVDKITGQPCNFAGKGT